MGLKDLINASFDLVNNILVPLAFGLCLLYFFWGVAKYIGKAGSDKGAEEGKSTMVWGVIALFVLFSVWGIIRFIVGEIGIPIDTEISK